MVAEQLRTVLDPHPRCVVASNYPDEGLPANEDGDSRADLPSRLGGTGHPAHTEARAELRDRETYYAELRFAVHCQSRSADAIPAPRTDPGADTWTRADRGNTRSGESSDPPSTGESWDEMVARFGDTWT